MKTIYTITCVLMIFGFSACSEKAVQPDPQIESEKAEMQVFIAQLFENTEIAFQSSEFTLDAGTKVKPSRLTYILGDFYLIDNHDQRIALKDQFALINAKKEETSFTLTDVPKGSYKAFGFSLGLDSAINHGDPNQYPVDHPLSAVNNALHWNWQGGYIFIAIEGKQVDTNDSYIYHIAGSSNKIDYEFPIFFEKQDAALKAQLSMQYEEIFKNPNSYDMNVSGTSVHSTTGPVTTALVQNMHGLFNIQSIK